MIAAVYKGEKKLMIEQVPVRNIDADELLIKVYACGVCGTDHHIFNGQSHSNPPVILGHEFSGVVTNLGASATEFKEGDRVAVDPNIACGYCFYCRSGEPNHCENLQALGVDLNGGFAEYAIVPFKQAYKIPDELSLDAAAFAEPLSCCLHGIRLACITSHNTVIIIGGGSIGLLMVQLARFFGALKVILIEPVEEKRVLGAELGADIVINPSEEDLTRYKFSIPNAEKRIVIECVGKQETAELALSLAGKNGKVVMFGLSPQGHQLKVDLQYVLKNEIQLLSSFLNPFTFTDAIGLLANNKVQVADLISKRISLNKISSIFESEINTQFIKHQVINHN